MRQGENLRSTSVEIMERKGKKIGASDASHGKVVGIILVAYVGV